MNDIDKYLVKMVHLQRPVEEIAKKLGWSVERVEQRWGELKEESLEIQKGAYGALVEKFTLLAHQYQLMGDTLKVLGGILGEPLSLAEASALLKDPSVLQKDVVILRVPKELLELVRSEQQSIGN